MIKSLMFFLVVSVSLLQNSIALANSENVSIYDLEAKLEDQSGKTIGLDVFRGHPTVIGMFYVSCPYACPMVMGKLKSAERDMSAIAKKKVRFLLISMRPEEDDVEALKEVSRQYKTVEKSWRFARTTMDNVREIAAVLGIKFNETDDGHTTLLSLVNKDGVVEKRVDAMREPTESLVKLLNDLAKGKTLD